MAFQLVAVGASLGGSEALAVLLGALPADFPLPVVVVQHRGKADETAGPYFDRHSALAVVEAEDKQRIAPGYVYLAPADYHLLVDPGRLALSTEAPVAFARPSIDLMFESAAAVYGPGVIAIVLTGMGQDGARGAAEIKRRGGVLLVQDPDTAAWREMPDAALAATPVDHAEPLPAIAQRLVRLCTGGRP